MSAFFSTTSEFLVHFHLLLHTWMNSFGLSLYLLGYIRNMEVINVSFTSAGHILNTFNNFSGL